MKKNEDRKVIKMRQMIVLLGALAVSFAAGAQPTPAPQDKASLLKDIVAQITDTARSAALDGVSRPFEASIGLDDLTPYLADLRMGREIQADDANHQLYESVLTLMAHGVDKEVGSTPDTKGTTSLAMKGDVPKLLGFAVEHGALTQQVNGNIATFRGTPAGLLKALAGMDTKDVLGLTKEQCDWCSKFSAAVSFDVSRGADSGTLTARKEQIASWSVRVALANHRDAKRREYFREFQRVTGHQAYTAAHGQLMKSFRSSQFGEWQANLAKRVKDVDALYQAKQIGLAAAAGQFSQILTEEFARADKIPLSDDQEKLVAHYAETIKPLLEQRNKIIDLANKGLLVTADWTVTRDPNVPDLSTVTGVLENGLGPGRTHDFTFNVAASFFNSSPKAPIHQFHDFKSTAQYDIPLGTFQSYGPFIFSLAGRFEFIPNDTLAPGGTITGAGAPITAAPSGNMFVGQAKLTIPVKGTGVRIPLSISASNRSELVKEKEVRGNIGITLDLDAVFAQAAKNSK